VVYSRAWSSPQWISLSRILEELNMSVVKAMSKGGA
jgi:hypothetical protein